MLNRRLFSPKCPTLSVGHLDRHTILHPNSAALLINKNQRSHVGLFVLLSFFDFNFPCTQQRINPVDVSREQRGFFYVFDATEFGG